MSKRKNDENEVIMRIMSVMAGWSVTRHFGETEGRVYAQRLRAEFMSGDRGQSLCPDAEGRVYTQIQCEQSLCYTTNWNKFLWTRSTLYQLETDPQNDMSWLKHSHSSGSCTPSCTFCWFNSHDSPCINVQSVPWTSRWFTLYQRPICTLYFPMIHPVSTSNLYPVLPDDSPCINVQSVPCTSQWLTLYQHPSRTLYFPMINLVSTSNMYPVLPNDSTWLQFQWSPCMLVSPTDIWFVITTWSEIWVISTWSRSLQYQDEDRRIIVNEYYRNLSFIESSIILFFIET